MKLTKGADVFNSKGDKIGALQRVIISPETKSVTHIVVEKGWLFTTNRLVSISQVDSGNDERVTISGTEEDLEKFPAFEETHYVNADGAELGDEAVGGAYWYPPADLAWWRTGGTNLGYYPPMPSYTVKTNQNIPEGTVALEEGARVVSSDEKQVGNIEQVIVDTEDKRATHFVIHGGLFTQRKLIPVLWINGIDEDEIRLSVGSELLDRLPEHKVETR